MLQFVSKQLNLLFLIYFSTNSFVDSSWRPSIQPSMVLKPMKQVPLPNWKEEEHQEVKDRSNPVEFMSKEVRSRTSVPEYLVTKEIMNAERGIPFSEYIMTQELPNHFHAPSHLPAYDGTIDPVEHIISSKMQRCCIGILMFASNKKYMKSTVSLFGVKQEEKETLRTYVQHFNSAILEVPATDWEILVSTFTKGLCGALLFESLAKKPGTNFLDVLARLKSA
ncbi:UNVERIFIED_CONTAM: hypothetical protein Sindi_1258300 [Sesamum indicum]